MNIKDKLTPKQWKILIVCFLCIALSLVILYLNVWSMDAQLKNTCRGTSVPLKIVTQEQIEDLEDVINVFLRLHGEEENHIKKLYLYSDGDIVVIKFGSEDEARRMVETGKCEERRGKYAVIYNADCDIRTKIHSIMEGRYFVQKYSY